MNVECDEVVALDIYRKTGQSGVRVSKIGSRWIVGFNEHAIERELSRGS